MLDKVVFKVLLVLTWNLAAEAMNCGYSIPASCMANTNIRLTMQRDYYDLQLCLDGQCIPRAGQEKWIRCNKMCDACKSIANDSHCGMNEGQCERRVSTFLNNYCRSNTPSTRTQFRTTTVRQTETTTIRIPTTIPTTQRVISTATCNITTTTVTRTPVTLTTTQTVVDTQLVTKTLPCQITTRQLTTTTVVTAPPKTCSDTATDEAYTITDRSGNRSSAISAKPDNGNKDKLAGSSNGTSVAALGALLGLSMILLAIVTAGWVWTLCAMKRKKSEKAASKANIADRDSTTERCFQNPTYEMKTTAQEPPKGTEVTYDVVACPGQTQPGTTGNGQTYAKLNRPKRNGHKPPRGMPSQQVNDDYSQLGLVNEDAENNYSLAGWEKERGHGGGDYADPDMEAEMVGRATEYEVPVPLRKNK